MLAHSYVDSLYWIGPSLIEAAIEEKSLSAVVNHYPSIHSVKQIKQTINKAIVEAGRTLLYLTYPGWLISKRITYYFLRVPEDYALPVATYHRLFTLNTCLCTTCIIDTLYESCSTRSNDSISSFVHYSALGALFYEIYKVTLFP